MSKKGWSSVRLLGSLVVCLVCVPLAFVAIGAQLDRAALNSRIALLEATEVTSPNVLKTRYNTAQERLLPILPPDPAYKLNHSGGIIVFDPDNFVYWAKVLEPTELNGVTVYPVTVVEDPETRNTVFYNSLAEPIGYLAPEQDYFPFTWLAMHHPEYYDENADPALLAWFEAVYDPARIGVTYWLLPADQVTTMAEAQLTAGEFQTTALNPLLLDELPELVTNLMFYGVEQNTNGSVLGLCWPESFTNQLDIYARSNLTTGAWAIVATNLGTAGTNSLIWTDVDSTGRTVRFYLAGNADLDADNDMLPDARETKLYGTCATNADTDGDGISDGMEILAYHTDPIFINNKALPYSSSFEQSDSYLVGQMDGQSGWRASTGVQIQAVLAKSGDQACQLDLGGETVFRGVASTDEVVTAEAFFFWSPIAHGPPESHPTNASALVSFGSESGIMAYNGNGVGGGTWITAPDSRLNGQWVSIKIEQNYSLKTWKLFINGIEKLNTLGFKNNEICQLKGMHVKSGGGGALLLDELTIQKK